MVSGIYFIRVYSIPFVIRKSMKNKTQNIIKEHIHYLRYLAALKASVGIVDQGLNSKLLKMYQTHPVAYKEVNDEINLEVYE